MTTTLPYNHFQSFVARATGLLACAQVDSKAVDTKGRKIGAFYSVRPTPDNARGPVLVEYGQTRDGVFYASSSYKFFSTAEEATAHGEAYLAGVVKKASGE